MLVSEIKWITDGKNAVLPSQVEVSDSMKDEEIADYLSNQYGFLVECFSLPLTDEHSDRFGEHVNEIEGKVS